MTAKASISSWWIFAFMALFLWYRNIGYDRALAIFALTLGLIQLIEYGIYSGTNPEQSGRTIFIILWLQCLVLAIGVWIFINGSIDSHNPSLGENIVHTIAGWNLLFFAIVFVTCLVISFTSDSTFSASPGPSGFIEWYMNGHPMLSQWGWLYFIGIFAPLFLIFAYYAWADLSVAILILYGILAAAFIFINYPSTVFGSIWSCFLIGFIFLAWFLGLIIVPQSNMQDMIF